MPNPRREPVVRDVGAVFIRRDNKSLGDREAGSPQPGKVGALAADDLKRELGRVEAKHRHVDIMA